MTRCVPSNQSFARLQSTCADALIILLFAGYMALFTENSVTRHLFFSPDSLVYIDAAQNFAAGNGLSQSTLMSHKREHLEELDLYPPLVTWAPLYPLTAGILCRGGLNAAHAALIVAAIFYALTIALLFALTRRLFDANAARLTLGISVLYWPLWLVGACAWSETLGIACLLGAIITALEFRRRRYLPLALLAGGFFGLAYATRYALLPGIALGALMLIPPAKKGPAVTPWLLLGTGFLLTAGPVFLRDYRYTGNFLGPVYPASTRNLWQNLGDAWNVAAKEFLPPETLGEHTQVKLLICITLFVTLIAMLRRRLPFIVNAVRGESTWLLLWFLGYCGFLLIYRSVYQTDNIGPRLLTPGLVALLPLAAGVVCAAVGPPPQLVRLIVLACLGAAVAGEASSMAASPRTTLETRAKNSERLRWIGENTTPNDLIIGDATMDIPIYCGFRHTLCFMAWEFPERYLTYETVTRFAALHPKRFEHIYLVVRKGLPIDSANEKEWRRLLGPFITDLVFGRAAPYPGITPLPPLRDTCLFEVSLADRIPPKTQNGNTSALPALKYPPQHPVRE